MSDKDTLGDWCKALERAETDRKAEVGLPVYARIDGHHFSAYTRKMERPFDERLSRAMVATMTGLVEAYHATIGYTQSDEISLVFYDPANPVPHDGKYQKLVSRLASKATALFAHAAMLLGLDRAGPPPEFDCRVFALPDLEAAARVLHWRQTDAIKNSVSMAARAYYSHKALFGKHRDDMLSMLAEKGVTDFFAHYPTFFTRGTWARRVTERRGLTEAEVARIPEQYRPVGPVERSSVKTFDLPSLSGQNKVALLFPGFQTKAAA